MTARTCPDWPELMELAPGPPVQALHRRRGAASGRGAGADLARLARRGRDLLRPRAPRLQPGAHRSRGVRRAARVALVRRARVGDLGPGTDVGRGLTSTLPLPGRRRLGRRLTRARTLRACRRSSIPYRGDAKRRLPAPIRAAAAVAMLGDVVAAALEVGRRARRDRRSRRRSARRRASSPTRVSGLGAAVAAGLARVDGHALVVNADLPCATPAAIARARGSPASRSSRPTDGTTNALSLPDPTVFAPLYGPGSADAVPRARAVRDGRDPRARGRRRHGRRPRAARRCCSALARARSSPSRVKVVLLSGGGGGARFARGLHDVLAPGELTVVGNVGDDVEILGPARLARSRQPPLHARGAHRRGARLGSCGRDVERARVGRRRGAARTGSGSATSTSGSISCARSALREGRTSLARSRRSLLGRARAARRGSSLRPTTGSARTSSRLRARSRSRSGSSAAATATRWTTVEYEGADEAPTRLPACSRSSPPPTAILLAPSNPYLSIGPILAVREIRRRARVAARAVRRRQPARRRQGGHRPGRPYALAHGRRHDTSSCRLRTRGPDRRPRDRRGGRAGRGRGRARRHADPDAGPRRRHAGSPSACWRRRAGSGRRRHRAVRHGARDAASGRSGLRGRDRLARRRAGGGGRRRARRRRSRERRRRARRGSRRSRDEGRRRARHRPRACGRRSARRRCSRSLPSSASRPRACSPAGRDRRSPSASRPSSTARCSRACTRSPRRASAAEEPPDEDAFVCGDDAEAKALALELAEQLTAGRALDAGPLASARALEGLTAVIVNLNKRYRVHAGIRVTGLR